LIVRGVVRPEPNPLPLDDLQRIRPVLRAYDIGVI